MVTYVLNIFNSLCCCLNIWQLKMIFTSQIVLNISLSKNVFHKFWIWIVFRFENFKH